MPTYYLDTTGADSAGRSGANTAGQQWYSWAYAVTRVSSGDTIYRNAGTYTETVKATIPVNINILGAGKATTLVNSHVVVDDVQDAFMVFSGGTNTAQTVSGFTLSGDGYTGDNGIIVYNRNNVNINNIAVTEFLIQGIRFDGTSARTGNVLQYSDINDSGGENESDRQAGLFIRYQTGILIHHNTLIQLDRDGVDTGLGVRVENNVWGSKIYSNTFTGLQPTGARWVFTMEFWCNTKGSPGGTPNAAGIGHGLEMYDNTIIGRIDFGSGVAKGNYTFAVSFHDNIMGPSSVAAVDAPQTGIEFEEYCSDVLIYNNEFKFLDRPIYIDHNGTNGYFTRVYIEGNLIRNVPYNYSDGGGITFGGTPDSLEVYNIYIRNNNILADGTSPAAIGIVFDGTGVIDNMRFTNNIIKGFTAAPYGTLDNGGTINALIIDTNLLDGNGNSNNIDLDGISPTNSTNDGGQKAAPTFVSASDFHLAAGSNGIADGVEPTPTWITPDPDGNARPATTPTIGVYEYYSVILVTQITVGGSNYGPWIDVDNGTMQMYAFIDPTNATDKTVTWSVTNGTGEATISSSGILTAVNNGLVTVTATANDGSGIYDEQEITITNQVNTTPPKVFAPTGWHVPTKAECETLIDYLGDSSNAGGYLKEAGTTHWTTPNTSADNSSGFTALAAGQRNVYNNFIDKSEIAYIWDSTVPDINNYCNYLKLYYNSSQANMTDGAEEEVRTRGMSVRLLKDTTDLSDGETGTLTDYDNITYPTICIDTQEWMAANFCCTHFTDGTPIPLVTGDAAWAALSSAGMCYYNNDIVVINSLSRPSTQTHNTLFNLQPIFVATTPEAVTWTFYWEVRDSVHSLVDSGSEAIALTAGNHLYSFSGITVPDETGINYDFRIGKTATMLITSGHFTII